MPSSSQLRARHEEAAEWFVAMQSDLSPAEIRRWEQWIVDPENRASYDALCSIWNRAKAIEPLRLPDAQQIAEDEYDGSVPFIEWSATRSPEALETSEDSRAPEVSEDRHFADAPGTAGVSTGEQIARRVRVPRAGRRALAVAAAVSTLAIAWVFYPKIADRPQLYETGVAEHRTLRLPDGSEMLLGARTSLSVIYTHQRRDVVLNRGEVLVHVAPQRNRPFAVLAGSGMVTAVGTRFAVKRNPSTDRVTVTVTEGVVRVEPHSPEVFTETATPSFDASALPSTAAKPPVAATLGEGGRVSYDEHGGLSMVQHVDPESAAAWRDGRLRYRDESLREVVSDVNRYSRREIIFLGQAADTLRYTGTVFQDDIDDWIDGLPGIFPLEIVETDAEHVLLRERHSD